MFFVLILTACLPAPDAPPFVCEGEPAPRAGIDGSVAPMGWVQIQSLSAPVRWTDWRQPLAQPAAAANPWGVATPEPVQRAEPNPQVWFDQQAARTHVAVSADAAPLHQLALALGQHLSLDVHVDEAVGQRVVTAAYQDTTLASFLQMLRMEHDVGVRFDSGVLTFAEEPPLCSWCDQPVLVNLFETDSLRGDPAALAAIYCQDFASPVGSAAVVGDQIYVRDTDAATQSFRQLYQRFQVSEGE